MFFNFHFLTFTQTYAAIRFENKLAASACKIKKISIWLAVPLTVYDSSYSFIGISNFVWSIYSRIWRRSKVVIFIGFAHHSPCNDASCIQRPADACPAWNLLWLIAAGMIGQFDIKA